MDRKIGFIGAGNMATTIINGLVNSFENISNNIYVSSRTGDRVERLRDELNINICENNIDLVEKSDLIFLAVKPDVYKTVLKEVNPHMGKEKIIISMVAGVCIDSIKRYFGQSIKIVRIMPNVAVNVNEGMIALSSCKTVTEEEVNLVVELLTSIGRVDRIDEALMDVVTSISSCSPAYIAMFVEALADGSVLNGMPRDKAYIYAAQTLIGTGKMILEKGIHPGQLKDLVSSPAGVTIEGVYHLERSGFRHILMETMEVCNKKMKS